MASNLSLSMEDSLTNYVNYKDDIEYEVSLQTSYKTDLDVFETKVMDEMLRRNLINYTFYNDQIHNIRLKYEQHNLERKIYNQYIYGTCMITLFVIIYLILHGAYTFH